MAVSWTPHRFSGGVLALDVANTVVLRADPQKTFDRFDDRGEIARFAEAASDQRAEELGGRRLAVSDDTHVASTVTGIRETTDRLFRSFATQGTLETGTLSAFLGACAAGFSSCHEKVGGTAKPFGDPATPIAFEAALAVSALSLLAAETKKRISICANCGWLFLDRSRNSSRLWCDMAVCGNRQKAKRHYRRQRIAPGEEGHA